MVRGVVRRARAVGLVLALAASLSGCWYHTNVPWAGGSIDDPVVVETLRIGGWNLAARDQPGWEVLGNQLMPKPQGNLALKSIDFSLVDAAGNPISTHLVHLHHIVMMDMTRPDPLCPEVGARFAASGSERTPLVLPGDYAYRVDAGDLWGSTFHVHTSGPAAVNGVYLQYEVTYERITTANANSFKYTSPYFFDVTGCWENSASEYNVPGGGAAGSEHVLPRQYTMPRNGTAVFAGGHLHAGGIDLSLTRDGTGEDYCTALPKYTPGGHPSHPRLGYLNDIDPCPIHSRVNAGERFTLRSTYDNQYPVAKAMGIMLMHVYEP
jgi:hypothetical protein